MLLDFTGGSFSLLQMFLQSYNNGKPETEVLEPFLIWWVGGPTTKQRYKPVGHLRRVTFVLCCGELFLQKGQRICSYSLKI